MKVKSLSSPLVLYKQCFNLDFANSYIKHISYTLLKKIKAPLNGLAKVSLIRHPILGFKVTHDRRLDQGVKKPFPNAPVSP